MVGGLLNHRHRLSLELTVVSEWNCAVTLTRMALLPEGSRELEQRGATSFVRDYAYRGQSCHHLHKFRTEAALKCPEFWTPDKVSRPHSRLHSSECWPQSRNRTTII